MSSYSSPSINASIFGPGVTIKGTGTININGQSITSGSSNSSNSSASSGMTFINSVSHQGSTISVEGFCKSKNLKLVSGVPIEIDGMITIEPSIWYDGKFITSHELKHSYKAPAYAHVTEQHLREMFDKFCAMN